MELKSSVGFHQCGACVSLKQRQLTTREEDIRQHYLDQEPLWKSLLQTVATATVDVLQGGVTLHLCTSHASWWLRDGKEFH